MALTECLKSFFPNRKICLVITLTATLFLPIAAITWNKLPPNPVNGILGENVTLEWNFTLTAAEVFDYFVLLRNHIDMVKYSENVGVVIYSPYNENYVRVRNGTSSFVLINLTRDDDGATYCCKVGTKTAGNLGGNLKRECTKLNISVRPAIESFSNNQTVNETGDLTLSCNATGEPIPSVKWSKADNANHTLSTSSLLRLTNISREQDGFYRCTADNGLGKVVASVRIIVQYRPSGTNLTTNATKNMAIEGLPVTFFCSADSVPPSVYELSFKGLSVDNSSNGIFTIQRVRASHQGTYECAARNILGIGPIATVNLDVLRPPSIDFISHNATANETDDVMLFCNATGNPPPNITWTSLSEPVPKVVRTGGTLTLSNVTRDQAGTYQCTATNGLMSAKTVSVYVKINYKPEVINETSADVMSWINHETKLRCEAKGVPLPELKWNRNGTVATYSSQSHSSVSILTFTPKEEIDFGLYSCTARNLLGSTTQKMAVVMLVEPEAPEALRIEPGFDHLQIHWSESSVTNPAGSVLDYLAQAWKKDEPEGWRNCTQMSQSRLTCVINGLESGTVYIARVAGRNVVGYSEFTEKEARTKTIDEVNDDEDDEGGPKVLETGKHERQQALPGYTIDAIIAGVIGFSSFVVMIVAIVTQRLKCRQENARYNVKKSSKNSAKVEASGHDNKAFVENQGNYETEEQV